MKDKPATLEDAHAEIERLQRVLEEQQYYAWDALRQAIITVDDPPALRPATGGRALRALLQLLEHSEPISIDRIDVETLAFGLYEAVMERAGLTPDPRVFNADFQFHASREFELEPGETLWDDRSYLPESVLEAIRSFSEDELRFVGPNLTHAEA